MRRLYVMQVCIFGLWVVTLIVAVVSFIIRIYWVRDVNFDESREAMSNLFFLITPQLVIMSTFFFGAKEGKFSSIIAKKRENANIAAIMSVIYHGIFVSFLVLGIALGILGGKTIDDNVSVVVFFMGVISVLGLPPVAYLFQEN